MIIASDYRLKQLVSDLKIKISKEVINRVSKEELLGILIDKKLTWEDHNNDIIIPKFLRGLRMLQTVRPLIPLTWWDFEVRSSEIFAALGWSNFKIRRNQQKSLPRTQGLISAVHPTPHASCENTLVQACHVPPKLFLISVRKIT